MDRMLRWAVVVVACQLVAASNALALDGRRGIAQYAQAHFAARDGMPHSLANSVAQTADGYLWIGSEEGLSRFDGARFVNFDHRNTDGIAANLITALATDRAGTLWAGTRDQGLVHLVDGEFRTVRWERDARPRRIQAIAFDAAGDLWAGTRDAGVVRLHAGVLADAVTTAHGLPSDDVRAFLVAPGAVWIATFRGLARWDAGRVVRGPAALDGVAVYALAADRAGDVWCATGRGLVRVHGDAVETVDDPALAGREVRGVQFDRDGNLWIATNAGVARRTPDGRITALATPAAMVLALFEDAAGDLWIGSEDGLDRLRDGDAVPVGAAEGLSDDAIFGMIEDTSGARWFGSDRGLYRWAPGEPAATRIVADATVYTVAQAEGGAVWVGGRDGNIGRWRDGQFAWIGKQPWEHIHAVAAIADALWIGNDHGAFRLRGDVLASAEPVITDDAVHSVLADGDTVWLGTEHGVRRWRAGGVIAAPPGGPVASISFIARDPDGTLWFCTEGAGLWRLRGDHWAAFDTRDGLFDDLIWSLVDDGAGNLWMSSNRGLWRVRRADLEARAAGERSAVDAVVYGEADGMRDRECNGAVQPPAMRTRDGRLWFPTGKGAVVFDPTHLRTAAPPTARIEAVRIDGEPQPITGKGVVLAPGKDRLEIDFTAPELRTPERVQFRFRLDGFDRRWNAAAGQRIAHYTNLSPGHYTLIVEAGVAGVWGPAGAIAVTQEPRFYQTRWFIALVIAALAALLVGAPLLRMRRLRAHARELDRRVQEAISELKVLSGMLPICAWCKKVRDDQGYWNRIEAYLAARTDAQFTHGICPDCQQRVAQEDEPHDHTAGKPDGAA
jgi:ligand-binding sensor domain-containing protein